MVLLVLLLATRMTKAIITATRRGIMIQGSSSGMVGDGVVVVEVKMLVSIMLYEKVEVVAGSVCTFSTVDSSSIPEALS